MLEAWRGIWKAEHRFALKQALELWECSRQKTAECDQRIQGVRCELAGPEPPDGPAKAGGRRAANRAANAGGTRRGNTTGRGGSSA